MTLTISAAKLKEYQKGIASAISAALVIITLLAPIDPRFAALASLLGVIGVIKVPNAQPGTTVSRIHGFGPDGEPTK